MMRFSIYESGVVIGIGLIGLVGSIQMQNQVKAMGITEALGPAKWTGAISLILIVCGMIPVIGNWHRRKSLDRSRDPATTARLISNQGMMLVVLLGVWLALVSILGYNLGNLCVLPMIFYVAGFRPWLKSIGAGLVMAVLFYLVFVMAAKMPVPRGGLGLL